jgi:hypothetical protein
MTLPHELRTTKNTYMTIAEFFMIRPQGPNCWIGLGAFRDRVRLKPDQTTIRRAQILTERNHSECAPSLHMWVRAELISVKDICLTSYNDHHVSVTAENYSSVGCASNATDVYFDTTFLYKNSNNLNQMDCSKTWITKDFTNVHASDWSLFITDTPRRKEITHTPSQNKKITHTPSQNKKNNIYPKSK